MRITKMPIPSVNNAHASSHDMTEPVDISKTDRACEMSRIHVVYKRILQNKTTTCGTQEMLADLDKLPCSDTLVLCTENDTAVPQRMAIMHA